MSTTTTAPASESAKAGNVATKDMCPTARKKSTESKRENTESTTSTRTSTSASARALAIWNRSDTRRAPAPGIDEPAAALPPTPW